MPEHTLDLKNLPAPEPEQVPEAEEPQELLAGVFPSSEPIAWEAHHPLSSGGLRRHYLLLGILGIGGSAIAFWQGSWSTLLVVLLAVGVLEIRERVVSPVQVRIDGQGLTVDGSHYPHAQLTSFDMHQMPDNTIELSIMTDRWQARRMRLPLGDQDPLAVRDLLLQYVPEQQHGVPFFDAWLRKD